MNPTIALAQWVALSLIPGLGRRSMLRLIEQLGSLDAVFGADDTALRAVPRIGPKLGAAIRSADVLAIQHDLAIWQADGIAILLHPDAPCPGTHPYPPALARLPDSPPILFQRGNMIEEDEHAIAVVGTRQPTKAGIAAAFRIAHYVGGSGWTVVSGLAEGVDQVAHQAALETSRSVAVLGCGVRVTYPPGSETLTTRLIQSGAILSETYPDASPESAALVARNRLISGLARALVVIETGITGGTLHTVRFARAQGVPVYVAADVDAPGNRQLIAEGAHALHVDEPFLMNLH